LGALLQVAQGVYMRAGGRVPVLECSVRFPLFLCVRARW